MLLLFFFHTQQHPHSHISKQKYLVGKQKQNYVAGKISSAYQGGSLSLDYILTWLFAYDRLDFEQH